LVHAKPAPVPESTRNADIKLDAQVSSAAQLIRKLRSQ
jgi:hypothetical protein